MKRIKGFLLLILVSVLLVGCSLFEDNTEEPKSSDTKEEQVIETDPLEDEVDKMMSEMTLDEKIAQMLVIYYLSDTFDDTLKDMIVNNTPGGFILKLENYTTYDGTKEFIDNLKKYSNIPMIISTDEEGGNVQRIKAISDVEVTDIPFMYDIGETRNTYNSKKTAKVMAEELRTLGINVTYAPVLDIFTNPNNTIIGKRAFGSDAKTVYTMALAFNESLEENGIMGVYKHFPGHGDTDVDSHLALPIVNKTYKELQKQELIPFQKAIDDGAKMIMVGHIALPNVTGDNTPSSLSKKVITDILKKDMKFDGLVITDALDMKALVDNYSDEEIVTMAINAGVDLLLMPNGKDETINIIKNNITEERINESVKRILLYKYKYLNGYKYLDKSYLGSEEHKSIINKIINNEKVSN